MVVGERRGRLQAHPDAQRRGDEPRRGAGLSPRQARRADAQCRASSARRSPSRAPRCSSRATSWRSRSRTRSLSRPSPPPSPRSTGRRARTRSLYSRSPGSPAFARVQFVVLIPAFLVAALVVEGLHPGRLLRALSPRLRCRRRPGGRRRSRRARRVARVLRCRPPPSDRSGSHHPLGRRRPHAPGVRDRASRSCRAPCSVSCAGLRRIGAARSPRVRGDDDRRCGRTARAGGALREQRLGAGSWSGISSI